MYVIKTITIELLFKSTMQLGATMLKRKHFRDSYGYVYEKNICGFFLIYSNRGGVE